MGVLRGGKSYSFNPELRKFVISNDAHYKFTGALLSRQPFMINFPLPRH